MSKSLTSFNFYVSSFAATHVDSFLDYTVSSFKPHTYENCAFDPYISGHVAVFMNVSLKNHVIQKLTILKINMTVHRDSIDCLLTLGLLNFISLSIIMICYAFLKDQTKFNM